MELITSEVLLLPEVFSHTRKGERNMEREPNLSLASPFRNPPWYSLSLFQHEKTMTLATP